MRRAFVILGLVLAGCIKPGIEDDPKGGADVTLFPSAATKGTPFVTPDGWTVTIHTFALRAAASDITTNPVTELSTGGGPGAARIMRPTPECHLRIAGATAGDNAQIGLVTTTSTIGDPNAELPPCGLDDATVKRFNELADDTGPYYPLLPGLIVDATATRDGKTLHVTFAAGSFGAYSDPKTNALITIKANVGAPVSFSVNAELFFAPPIPTGVTFDEIAYCDKDGDGVVTGKELNDTPRTCAPGGFGGFGDDDDDSSSQNYCPSVLVDLTQNLNFVFGPGVIP